jgi:hypothetical protein
VINDILLFPHCDLHMALTGTPPLKLRLFNRLEVLGPGPPLPYVLTEVAFDGVDFFAPHNALGDRRKNLPSVDLSTGLVTARTPGVYLFQFRAGNQYLVGRLQVHNRIVGWWFGNDSITTAVDGTIFHAQPSIYARFDDDPATGTDLVGDITGHGYVPLTSSDQTKFATNADGRLRGVAETADSPAPLPQVSGTFLNQNNKLTVRVYDALSRRLGDGGLNSGGTPGDPDAAPAVSADEVARVFAAILRLVSAIRAIADAPNSAFPVGLTIGGGGVSGLIADVDGSPRA